MIGLVISSIFPGQTARAASSWVQTDWSGGSGSSTSNQYSAISNLDATGTAGLVDLSNTTSWYDIAWKYRKKVTFDNRTATLGTTSENLTDFPVLVKLDKDTDIDYAKVNSDGFDLRFIDTDGTVLKYEFEKWDITGTSYVWVKVPQVAINSNTDYIYMYYGNTAATTDTTDKNNVWNSGYKGVWHMGETSGNVNDSTVNGYNGTRGSTTAVTGKVGSGQNLTGASYVSTALPITSLSPTFTMEAWATNPYPADPWKVLIGETSGTSFFFGKQDSSNSLHVNAQGVGYFASWGANLVFDGGWHHIVWTFVGSTSFSLYIDGTFVYSAVPSSGPTSAGNIQFGRRLAQEFWRGVIDETRISTVARSAAWVAASYRSSSDIYASYAAEEIRYASSGTITSNIFDTGTYSDWGVVTYATGGTGTITVKARTSNSATMVGATDWASVSTIASGDDISSKTGVTDMRRYVQYQIALAISGTDTPTFLDISITYSPSDLGDPNNPSSLATAKSQKTAGTDIVSDNGWYPHSSPYFTWSEPADPVDINGNSSGIAGYYIYFGTTSSGDPHQSSGIATELGGAGLHFQTDRDFEVSVDTAAPTSGQTYYLRIETKDNADNIKHIAGGDASLFIYKYDGNKPDNPHFISVSPSGYSSLKTYTFTWPTADSSAAEDTGGSGLLGYQYKINDDATWYGSGHTGASTDVIPYNTGTLALPVADYSLIVQGVNTFYLRTIDNAGNISATSIEVPVKYNTSAPLPPTVVNVNPGYNTVNNFSFSWPAADGGEVGIAKYYYSVNDPDFSARQSTTLTSLNNQAFATRQSPLKNRFCVVAEDNASNVNFDNPTCVDFIADTPAPGMPEDFIVSDQSVRTVKYKVSLSWSVPTDQGIGVAKYYIYRKSGVLDWTELDDTTNTYYTDNTVDAGTEYYYKVNAADSAEKISADSTIVSIIPKGEYESPAAIVSGSIIVKATSRTATVTWQTDPSEEANTGYVHTTNSMVAFGKTTTLGTAMIDDDMVSSHTIILPNLEPSTQYHYRVSGTDGDENGNNKTESDMYIFTTDAATTITNKDKETEIRQTTAILKWDTSRITTTKLNYGKTTSYNLSYPEIDNANDTPNATSHIVFLKGLDAGTQYFYQLEGKDEYGDIVKSDNYIFTTLPYPKIENITFQPLEKEATTTIEVAWETNVPTDGRVRYAPTDGSNLREEYDGDFKIAHKFTIGSGKLLDQKTYIFTALVRDQFGNEAISDNQTYTTPEDTRPAIITNLQTEVSIEGAGDAAKVSAVVTWDTDEPADSQVFYGSGTSGDFDNSTTKDSTMVTSHLIVISDLKGAQTYHLKAASVDKSGNPAESSTQNFVTNQPSQSVVSIILSRLQQTFGWMTSIGGILGN